MRFGRPAIGLFSLLALLCVACGAPGGTETPTQKGTRVPPAAPVEPPAADGEPTAVAALTAEAAPTADVRPPLSPASVPDPTASPASVDLSALENAAKSSVFHQFGDDVYTWDAKRQVVIQTVPVGHRSIDALRSQLGHQDGSIKDTPRTRSWVQECARHRADQAFDAPAAVYGAIVAQSVYSCLGGLSHLAELFSRYWWTSAGLACVADAVIEHSHLGDARPRPLAACPSIGYDPNAPRPDGWLIQRCWQIVAANPNPEYPSDPDHLLEPLPSCWRPILEIVEAHAAERAEVGLPDGHHACFHSFLGYVWARQAGRESRPPSHLSVGCDYHAFEAIP